MCKRLALMGPETMTDVVYYDLQQWYVDINAVKPTRIVWTDIGTLPWQPCSPWTWHCNAIFFDLSNNSENFFSASSRQWRKTTCKLSICIMATTMSMPTFCRPLKTWCDTNSSEFPTAPCSHSNHLLCWIISPSPFISFKNAIIQAIAMTHEQDN